MHKTLYCTYHGHCNHSAVSKTVIIVVRSECGIYAVSNIVQKRVQMNAASERALIGSWKLGHSAVASTSLIKK
jgi:hypothetical protein